MKHHPNNRMSKYKKLQDDFHFENANHAKINNSNETGNQSNISHSKRSQYSTK